MFLTMASGGFSLTVSPSPPHRVNVDSPVNAALPVPKGCRVPVGSPEHPALTDPRWVTEDGWHSATTMEP